MSSVNFQEPENDTVAMFCYTSGTTGDPKAVKLTHGNFIGTATAAVNTGFDINHNDSYISYLPLAHSFEKVLFACSMVVGC